MKTDDLDIVVFESHLFKFEFDNYSVFYDTKTHEWFLDFVDGFDEDEGPYILMIENETTSFLQNEDELKKFGFLKEDFEKLKKFVSEERNEDI